MRKLLLIFFFLPLFSKAGDILTPNGYVSDSKLKAGDKVIGYDLTTGKPVVNTIIEKREMDDKWYSAQHEVFEYIVVNDTYKFFAGQSVFANKNVVHASELKLRDVIYDLHGKKIVVKNNFNKQQGKEMVQVHHQWRSQLY